MNNEVSEKIIIIPETRATSVIINATAGIDQKESNSNISSQTLISGSRTNENLDLEKINLDPRSKNASETINTNVNYCFTNELVTPQLIATNEERRQGFETTATTDVIETIDTPKTMSLSRSISTLEEAKASPQLLSVPDQLAALTTVARKINYDSQFIPNLKNPGTTSEQIKEVVIDQILIPVENVNVPSVKPAIFEELSKDSQHEVALSNPNNTSQPQSSNTNANSGSTNANISSLKQAIFEKLNKDPQPEVSSSNIYDTCQPQSSNSNTNNGINVAPITEATTIARSLPALPPLTSNTKKMQPVAKIKPMPTNNPSRQDETDDDDDDDEIEVLEEIIDVDKYRSKNYTEAFVTPDGCIIDLNSQVIGHLDPEKTKNISFKPGEPLITLRQDEIKYVSKAGCSKTKTPLSKDDTEKILEGSCTSKKIIKPMEQVPCENKRTEDKDDREPRKKSSKKKPKTLVVEKRSLPVRSKKRTEEGFYKKFAEDAEEDILNASDNDYDDPSYEPEEVFPIDDNSNSNEMNGTEPNSGEDREIENSDAPSTSGEIISKEGTAETKEPESPNKKIIRAMPLSVRLKKEEEKRKRIESESKVENINTPISIETDSNSIQTNEMDPKLKETENSDEASGINQEKMHEEAESSNEKNKRVMPLSVRLKKKGGEEWKCVESESRTEIEKVSKAPASIDDNSNSDSYFAPNESETNGADSNSIEGNKVDPKPKEMENSADVGSINEKNLPSTTGEIISKDATTHTEKEVLSNKKNKRAMPLSVRLQKKGEEKRRRVESESKAQNKNGTDASSINQEKENIAKDGSTDTKEAESSSKKYKRAMPLSVRLKKKGEEKRRRVGSKAQNETNVTDASSITQEKENIAKDGSTDTKEAESSNKQNKRAMPLSVRLKKKEEKRRRVESESIREIEEEPALLVPKVETCDYSSPIAKIKEAWSSSSKVKPQQIDTAPKISATLVKKEIISEDSFEQVNIQSQSVPASELTSTSNKSLPTSSAISDSPICVENFELTNNELMNSVVSCEALRMSPEKVPEQIEMETEIALMITNVTSLALPDEDLVGFSPAVDATYSMVKATRADLMKNLVAHESIFKISTRDSIKLFQHAFNNIFKKPN